MKTKQNKRQKVELSDIFSEVLNKGLNLNDLHPFQEKAFQAILACRTVKLGGHVAECNHCHHYRNAYNSCRDRHCPKCQMTRKIQWVDKLKSNLPEVKHFHLVFTIPESLNKLFYINQRIAYDSLFKAASQALMQCGENNEYLGAKMGGVAVLHTWGQTMSYHPHIHMIVPSGGLTEDGFEWVPSHKKFFLPVKVLSAIFRGLLMKTLEKEYAIGKLKLPDDIQNFKQIKDTCYQKKWVVYSEKPFTTPDNIIKYLGNYTHRVAISNQRIISHKNGKVTFYYKNYKKAGLKSVMTLDESEFVRRFLQHILPSGLCKVRYIGFLALRHLKENVELCATINKSERFFPKYEGLNAYEVYREIKQQDPLLCPKCKKGHMVIRKPIERAPS
ncbi:MAG: IS91 family transposase [Brumimicrobium sp.]|nr:IS91 family transposase [Ignavibacteria bacterium]MCO5267512.1 IS91 family transposase [Brumimicrobium sp.]MCO5267591.1 IS91 family transposase [Brumimicrobium sp.]MCO5267595.1 IS91 family transposase [Brumimicrobium sp.]MCO5267598.1 IS91 family transposase [Brumimicrobium sp.]